MPGVWRTVAAQFAVPISLSGEALASVAAIAAQMTADDSVLEPSAGTGILAGFAARVTRNLILNEICLERLAILGHLFP